MEEEIKEKNSTKCKKYRETHKEEIKQRTCLIASKKL
jgi:hypothetical protein